MVAAACWARQNKDIAAVQHEGCRFLLLGGAPHEEHGAAANRGTDEGLSQVALSVIAVAPQSVPLPVVVHQRCVRQVRWTAAGAFSVGISRLGGWEVQLAAAGEG
jgi:hypothetical protein